MFKKKSSSVGSKDPVTYFLAESKELVETTVLPPPPPPLDKPNIYIRPSIQQALRIEAYLHPTPRWGLRVNLASLFLGPENASMISRALILNKTVSIIDFSMCDLGTAGALELFRCLRHHETIREVNVCGNFIGPEGASKAAECLGHLEVLHIACNAIEDKGCLSLADALVHSETMRVLNVRGNHITNYGIFHLIKAMDPLLTQKLSLELKKELLALERLYHYKLQHVTTPSSAVYTSLPRIDAPAKVSKMAVPPLISHLKALRQLPKRGLIDVNSTDGEAREAQVYEDVLNYMALEDSFKSLNTVRSHEKASLSIVPIPSSQSEGLSSSQLLKSLLFTSRTAGYETTSVAPEELWVTDVPVEGSLFIGNASKNPQEEFLPQCNTSLQAVWIQLNDTISDEFTEILAFLCAQRYPPPPPGFKSKKKRRKKSSKRK